MASVPPSNFASDAQCTLSLFLKFQKTYPKHKYRAQRSLGDEKQVLTLATAFLDKFGSYQANVEENLKNHPTKCTQ